MNNDDREIQAKLTELGGSLVGGATGEMAGAAIGGAIVCLFTGPLGLCTSGLAIAFASGVIGTKLGAAIAHTLIQLDEVENTQPLWETAADKFQANATEKIGEISGEVTGGLAGLFLYGHAGELVGTIVGGKLARQLEGSTTIV